MREAGFGDFEGRAHVRHPTAGHRAQAVGNQFPGERGSVQVFGEGLGRDVGARVAPGEDVGASGVRGEGCFLGEEKAHERGQGDAVQASLFHLRGRDGEGVAVDPLLPELGGFSGPEHGSEGPKKEGLRAH